MTKRTAEDEKMNKRSWQAQRTVQDIEQWREWLLQSLDRFKGELATQAGHRDLPNKDRAGLTQVREELSKLEKHLVPLEKALRKHGPERVRAAPPKTDRQSSDRAN